MPMINCPTCGAGLKVPEGMAGRKARCNKCQNIFPIPETAPAMMAGSPMAPPGPTTPSGSYGQAPPPYAPPPQQAPYPPSGQYPPQQAPYPPGQFAPPPGQYQPTPPGYAPPGYAPAPAGQHAPGHAPMQGAPPRSAGRKGKKKGFPVLLVSLLAGGLLLVIVLVVVLMILFWGSSGGSADLAFLSDDTTIIQFTNVKGLKSSGAWPKLKEEYNLSDQLTSFKQNYGIAGDEIESLLSGQSNKGGLPTLVIRTSAAYTPDRIMEHLNWKDSMDKESVGNFTLYKRKDNDRSFCVVNANLVVFGTNEAVKKILTRNGKPNFSESMQNAVNGASFSNTFVAVVSFDTNVNLMPGVNINMPNNPFADAPRYTSVEMTVATKINMSFVVAYRDDKKAENSKAQLESELTKEKNSPTIPLNKKNLLDNVRVSQSGTKVTISASGIDPDWLKSLKTSPGGAVAGFGSGMSLPGFGSSFSMGLGPAGNNPVLPPPQVGVTQKNGPFVDNVHIKPGDRLTYQFPVSSGQNVFTVTPQPDAILNIKVTQNGQVVGSDFGLKKLFNITWTGVANGIATVEITSTDNLANSCSIVYSHASGGAVPSVNANSTTKDNIAVGSTKVYNVYLQAGRTVTIRCSTLSPNYDPYLWLMSPQGQVVAQDDDGDGFPNAKIVYIPPSTGTYQIKVGSANNSSGGTYQLQVQQQ